MTATETVTVLFTDVARSTAVSSALGTAAADELRRTHFALLRGAIAETGGREVKTLGDGVMVTFGSATAAVDCAIAMQQLVHSHAGAGAAPIGLRVGVSQGDAVHESDDWFGIPVVEAARLCDAAREGQILVHDVLRMFVGSRDGHEFEGVGELELKGLPEPVPAAEAVWHPLPADEPLPLPQRLEPTHARRFLGRGSECQALLGTLDEAADGVVRIALVSGEPGIGKTRLCKELAARARERGASVIYGRCEEGLGLPYEPIVEALGHLVAHVSPMLLARHLAEVGGDLARLVPELARRVPNAPRPRPGDGESERYMAFAATDSLLSLASELRPLVMVLDDLHWADRATVTMLRYLLASPARKALLVVGTFRSTELPKDHPLSELRADLHRREEARAVRLPLKGLSDEDVEALVTDVAGHELGEEGRVLALALQGEADGNPFFVAEILRHLAETGAIAQEDGRWVARDDLSGLDLPGSVAETVTRRVARIGEPAAAVLAAGAVMGREFDVDLLARALGQDEDELVDVLDAAADAALIAEVPGEPRYGFVHALIVHVLYDSLGAARRRSVHRRVAQALEELCGDAPGARVAELAHHWTCAGGDPGKAIEYAAAAGRYALDHVAPQEAAGWFGKALELVEGQPEEAQAGTRRVSLLLGLGEAQRDGGDAAFRETLLAAAGLASELGDRPSLVRAALANNRGWVSASGEVDPERVAVLEDALRAVPDGISSDRALLAATLAAELAFSNDFERCVALSDEALAMARRLGEPHTLSTVLALRFVPIWTPETLEERLANADEGVEAARAIGDPVLEYRNVHWRGVALVEAGRLGDAARDVEVEGRLADRLRQPTQRWQVGYDRANLAGLRGQLDEAEDLAAAALQIGVDSSQPDAFPFYAAQITCVRYDQGRLGELQPLVAQTVEQNPGIPAFRALLALTDIESGHDEEARELLLAEAGDGFSALPYDLTWISGLSLYSLVCTHLAEPEPAAELYRLLQPWEGQFVFSGVSSWGAVDLHLGTLARVLGHHDESLAHLAAAQGLHDAMDSPVWRARTRFETARSLLARDDPGDRDRALSLLEGARGLGALGVERHVAAFERELHAHGAARHA